MAIKITMSKLYFSLIIYFLTLSSSFAQATLLPDSLTNAPDSVKMWALREVGDSLIFAGLYVTSKQAFQQALAMAQAKGDRNAIAMGNRGMGFWHEQTGDYGQAIAWYQKALQSFQESGNTKQFARTLRFVSDCYDRLQNYKQALNYIKQSLALAEKYQYTDLVMQGYEGLAIYESKAKRYQQALILRKKVLAYYESTKDSISYYQALYNIGLLYKNMGQYGRSEQAFKDVLAYGKRQKNDFLIGYAYISLPYALIPQNKLDEAETCCRLALAWVEKVGGEKHTFLEEINGHLSHLWEKRGNYQQALLYYRLQMVSHDSIVSAEKNRQVAELETRYQTRQKEAEIQELAESNAEKNRQIWAAVGGLILLAVLLGTLYNLYERVRRNRQKIQHQSEQLTLMMREIHHRAKNNLAIVSSLLYLQTASLDDDDVIQTMRVGQQRVEAMALIHQRLYQTDQTTTIEMAEYLTDLTESLLKAYGYQVDDFDLQLTIDVEELDVDTAMPLGLIANELITNSLKYAYDFGQRPLLHIWLGTVSRLSDSDIILEVQDNGPGIDMADWQQTGKSNTFGKHLVTLLSQQLNGMFEVINHNGTLFRLIIPQSRLNA
jgi:two-component sensor histidine kinase/tetratricopeptide (TPR) repeat protein